MDSSTENLLHGEIDELKSCHQNGPTEAQLYTFGKQSKVNYFSPRTIGCLSLILNLILIISLLLQREKATTSSRSKYGKLISENIFYTNSRLLAGLIRDVPIEWNPYSTYGTGNKNETNRSIMWESLDVSPGGVSLDKQWAKDLGLPPAQPFPWDKSRSLYLLNGHHSLHCMVCYPVSCAY